MLKGRNWAVWVPRPVIGGILIEASILDLIMGLDVFHKPLLVLPLFATSMVWLFLSFK